MEVEYKDLESLGYPGYRVGNDGSVWTKRIWGRNPKSKANPLLIKKIRKMGESGQYSIRQIGSLVGLNNSTVGDIIRRKNWAWVD